MFHPDRGAYFAAARSARACGSSSRSRSRLRTCAAPLWRSTTSTPYLPRGDRGVRLAAARRRPGRTSRLTQSACATGSALESSSTSRKYASFSRSWAGGATRVRRPSSSTAIRSQARKIEPVRDDDDQRTAAERGQEIAHVGLRVDVQRAGRLVEDQDGWPAREDAAMATRWRWPPDSVAPVVSDRVVQPAGPLLELCPKPCIERCPEQRVVVELLTEEADVVARGCR